MSKYQVERFLDRREGNTEYLVKWKGYKTSNWQPTQNLAAAWNVVDAFENGAADSDSDSDSEINEENGEVTNSNDTHELEAILDKINVGIEYLVKWKHFNDPDNNTWENKKDLKAKAAQLLMKQFEEDRIIDELLLEDFPNNSKGPQTSQTRDFVSTLTTQDIPAPCTLC